MIAAGATAIGSAAQAQGAQSLALGAGAVAVGNGAVASADGSIAIGQGTGDNGLVFLLLGHGNLWLTILAYRCTLKSLSVNLSALFLYSRMAYNPFTGRDNN
ncbi:hemagglutination repeat-containing protein [Yersinia similis]|uniref:hypothetical protein n=1 Tax=Yersinia similis TaxID=367190 RepID=UPI0005DD7977|nr:hypothetical protein [Yersinia similis]CNE89374.1 hemagglutination repeat-containing protein [Yersinia similis]